jgi:archaetidylinositol phosphate synthase
MSDIKPHKRVNDILLGPLERPALQWLAAHMPVWMTPDILTGIGILGSVVILAAYGLSDRNANFLWLVNLGFVINWFGDSLDGTLARYRQIERPKYGFFVDHTVDAVSQVFVVLGLGLSPYVRYDVASLALVGYLMMTVYVYVDTYVSGRFKISYGKLGPTEVRLIVILANTAVYFFGNPNFEFSVGILSVFDIFVLMIALLLFLIFFVSVFQRARELAAAEQTQ